MRRKWTKEELNILQKLINEKTNKQLAEILNTTESAVEHLITKYNIPHEYRKRGGGGGKKRNIECVHNNTSCWIVTSRVASRDGYVYIGTGKNQQALHREYYKKYKGEIPKGMLVRHTCDNKLCINPDHLILGTHKDNSQDMVKRGRSMRYGKVHNTKLTIKQVKEIKKALKNNYHGLVAELARKYNIKAVTIHDIKIGKIWSYIKV